MDRIGEYLVKRMLGEGGMGKVYEGEERLSGRRVALKVLRPELTRSDDGRRLFLNEMQILARLEHANVVRSLASLEAEGQLVMVLEYLDGKTLREELTTRGRFPWHEAVELVSLMAEALAAAHGMEPPVVHRDLKPENVMLTKATTGAAAGLKVMDFGIAKVVAAAQGTNTQSIGTLQYMSPEQIDARPLDARSDLYALGLVLYELLAGAPPFHSASPRELLNMQCTQEPPELPRDARAGVPQGVETLMFSLLEKDPAARPPTARAVLDQLSPFRAATSAPRRRTTLEPTPSAAAVGALEPQVRALPSSKDAAAVRDPARSSGAYARSSSPPTPKTDTLPSGAIAEVKRESSEVARAPGGDVPKVAPHPNAVKRADTLALVEKNTATREVSLPRALLVIGGLSLAAGLVTYGVRWRVQRAPETALSATASNVSLPPSPSP